MPWTREEKAARAARETGEGFYVNLGIGIRTLIANCAAPDLTVTLPIIRAKVVDMGITDLAGFPFAKRGGPLHLLELAPGVMLEDVRANTQTTFEATPT